MFVCSCCIMELCFEPFRHTVPAHRWEEAQGKDLAWYQNSLNDGSPVFIYFHGNTLTRYYKYIFYRIRKLSRLKLLFHNKILFVRHFHRAALHRVGVAKVSFHQKSSLKEGHACICKWLTAIMCLQLLSALGYHVVVPDYRGMSKWRFMVWLFSCGLMNSSFTLILFVAAWSLQTRVVVVDWFDA